MIQSRRKFLFTGLQFVGVGAIYSIIPRGFWLPISEPENFSYYSFDAFKKEFQENLKKRGLAAAMAIEKPELLDKKWHEGQGQTGTNTSLSSKIKDTVIHFEGQKSESNTINRLTGYAPQKIISPLCELKTNEAFDYHVQLMELKNGQTSAVLVGPSDMTINGEKLYSYEMKSAYFLHPAFMRYIGNDLYFCYGDVCTNPNIGRCYFCSNEYVSQSFFYNGVSKLDPMKKYSASFHTLYANAKCSSPKSVTGYHNNEPLKELAGCECESYPPRQDQVKSKFF